MFLGVEAPSVTKIGGTAMWSHAKIGKIKRFDF